uniref:Trypsin inhibitor n=1 Tax=Fagopyrum tataricum TaxID=62330 RepID=ITI_FAGTA|nr:RecName: Full=Trypsin inhibitor; Short=FtTI [Fagopyrum tataricum]
LIYAKVECLTTGVRTYVGKQSWPELVGTKGKTAAATIDKENTHVTAVLCPPLTTLAACRTFDFRCDRVRVLINRIGGVVTKTPTVG